MTNKRFMVDDAGTLIDMQTKDMFDIVEEVCPLLNELHEENQSLKEENKFLRNKVATYKSGNALLKKTLDKEWK